MKFPWLKPAAGEVFGGRYDPANLRFPINWLAGDAPATDLLDVKSIQAWGRKIRPLLAQ